MEKMYKAYEGIITALSPIFHGGDEKTGSTPVLRTIYIATEEGDIVPVPYISGNAIRGRLRRLIIADLLRALDYEIENTKLHHILFSGGVLESTMETYAVIDLEFRRTVRDTLIPISLLGCAMGNQMIPGILQVEHMWPVCKEYKHYLPEQYRDLEQAEKSVRVYTDESFITRRDDLRAERQEDEQAVQMKVDYECFIPGTKFFHRFVLRVPTDLELSCFGRMIELWAENPTIGGRSSAGDGKLRLEYNDIPSSELYLSWVSKHTQDIRGLLEDLEGRL